VIRQTILAERAFMNEVVGEAIGTYGNQLLDEVETMIAKAVDKARAELRAEVAEAVGLLRRHVDTQGSDLRAELEKVIARKQRARAAKPNGGGSLLQLPSPNGNAHHPQ
jgi:hypothetical protein